MEELLELERGFNGNLGILQFHTLKHIFKETTTGLIV